MSWLAGLLAAVATNQRVRAAARALFLAVASASAGYLGLVALLPPACFLEAANSAGGNSNCAYHGAPICRFYGYGS